MSETVAETNANSAPEVSYPLTIEVGTSQPSSSSSMETSAPSAEAMAAAAEELRFKQLMQRIKDKLKKKKTFDEGIAELLEQMDTKLNFNTKKLFYDALNIISYRVGKPGFSVTGAKSVFDVAMKKLDCFSSGYKRNIRDWAATVDEAQASKSISERTDGRFNSRKKTTTPRRQNRALIDFRNALLNRYIMMNLFGFNDDMYTSSDSEDSDEEFGYYGGSFSNYDTGGSKFYPELPDGVEYPFSKLEQELVPSFRLEHSAPFAVKSFTITDEQFESLSKNCKVEFYCFARSIGALAQMPSSSEITVNGQVINFLPFNSNLCYDISKNCKKGLNELKITPSECCCSNDFSIKLREEVSIESMVEKVKETKIADYDTCFSRVVGIFKKDSEIEQVSLQVSLRCPLTLSRIDVPVRGASCTHLQCFDLQSYLQINVKHPKFECPVCYKMTPYPDLVLDSFFNILVTECKSQEMVNDIQIFPDGTWVKVAQESKKRKAEEPESEDDEEPDPKRQKLSGDTGNACCSTTTTQVIDLCDD